jgi:hypothetical protein
MNSVGIAKDYELDDRDSFPGRGHSHPTCAYVKSGAITPTFPQYICLYAVLLLIAFSTGTTSSDYCRLGSRSWRGGGRVYCFCCPKWTSYDRPWWQTSSKRKLGRETCPMTHEKSSAESGMILSEPSSFSRSAVITKYPVFNTTLVYTAVIWNFISKNSLWLFKRKMERDLPLSRHLQASEVIQNTLHYASEVTNVSICSTLLRHVRFIFICGLVNCV